MTERKITGDTAKSKYREAQKLAAKLGLADDALAVLAEGVREFDSQQSAEVRTVKALERVAEALAPRKGGQNLDGWEYEERRLRRREVYAQELVAVAMLCDDVHDEVLASIRRSPEFGRMADRLAGAADSAAP